MAVVPPRQQFPFLQDLSTKSVISRDYDGTNYEKETEVKTSTGVTDRVKQKQKKIKRDRKGTFAKRNVFPTYVDKLCRV